jgi:hypothetical protein
MIYPMAQSVALVCVDIDKKNTPQWHCPWSTSSSINKISQNYLNFEYVTQACQARSLLSVDCGAANTHCVQKRDPTCQGVDEPRHYQHTLIA